MTDLISKRDKTRRLLVNDALVHLARVQGHASVVDVMQIQEAVASTMIDMVFDDE